MPDLEYKTVPLHEAKIAEGDFGSISGYASTFGGVDSYGDTIVKGAYAKYLPEFLKSGFIAWSHNWEEMIGMPVAAQEDDHGLYLMADFHSHAEAQKARSIASERLAKGLRMGLSIGYITHKWSMQDSPLGGEQVRALEEIELFETSLVALPADSRANATGVKASPLSHRPGLPEDRFSDQGKRALPYTERFALLTDLLNDLPSHAAKRLDMRAEDPRIRDEIQRLETLSALLDRVRDELTPLYADLKAGAPLTADTQQPDLTLLRLQVESNLARLAGLPA